MHRIKTRQSRTRRLLCFTLGVSTSLVAHANPQGPAVAAGNVSFANPNATTLDITNSPNAIVNWQSFDIGVGETTRFIQQDAASAVLNRVTTPNASEILGTLASNGRVFLVNPSGILIGRDGMVDTAGLVMSTLNITNEDFMAGRFQFNGGPDSGDITNRGYLKTTPGGEVVLLAPKILNAPEAGNPQSGIIESEHGELILAAGYSITITSLDDPDISFEVEAPAGEVVNLGQLIARGGSVDVLAGTIRHSGEINADALSVDGAGRIVLVATKSIETTAGSMISARGEQPALAAAIPVATTTAAVEAPPNPVGANGGDVSIKALPPAADPAAAPVADPVAPTPTTVALAGRVDVTGARGGKAVVEADVVTVKGTIDASGIAVGGTVHVLGDRVKAEGATVRANAETGNAGDIRFGGELQGASSLRAADTAVVDSASRFEASAKDSGHGGDIIVWSNDETIFKGTAEARAGAGAGDGGLVEVSGKEILRFAGSVDVGAPRGSAGTLLLDPRNIFIVQGGATVSVDNPTPFAGDGFGSSFSVLGNGNILVVNQGADFNGFTDAGEITLLDSNGNVLGSVGGNAANEQLGAFGSFSGTDGNRFFRSPDASDGGLADAGALILFNISTGAEVGRTSGLSAGERFSQGGLQFASGNLIVSSTLADVGGNVDAGSVVVVNGTTGTALGRLNGTSANEFFGTTLRVGFTAVNTFVVQSATADIGGLADAGRVVMGSSLTGQQLGQVVGTAVGDQIGSTVDYFSTGAGTYLIRSAVADVGGLSDAGTAILVSNSTGAEIGRTNGLAAGDNLGSIAAILRSSGNYFLQVPNADISGTANAGSLVLVNGTTGTRIGSVDGSGTNEQLGFDLNNNALGAGDVLLLSEFHDNPGIGTVNDQAGGVFAVADIDLGSGNILRGSTLGASAGERFGSNGIAAFVSGGLVFISENADTGGFTDNGSVVVVGFNGAEVGRVDGTDDNEFLGSDGIIQAFNGNYWIPSTNFAPIPSTPNAGSVILASGGTGFTAGTALGRFDGTSTNEQFGSDVFINQLFNGDLLVRASGHAGGAGIIAQLASVGFGGGVIKRGSVDGTTAGDLTGATLTFRPFGNYIVGARNADVAGNINAGSVFVVDDATGSTVLRVDGTTGSEQLGQNLEFGIFDTLGGSLADSFAILSPSHGGNSEGAVFFVNSEVGAVTRQIDGLIGDTLGSFNLQIVPGGHLAIRNPFSDAGGANAGEILFVNAFANFVTSGSVLGISSGELLGNVAVDTGTLSSLGTGQFLVYSPVRDVSGETDAGTVLLMQGSGAVNLQGAFFGLQAGDGLGSGGSSSVQILSGGRLVLFNPAADDPTGALGVPNNEGAVILASTTSFSELGRSYGQTDDNEGLGSVAFVTERPNGNLFIHSPGAGTSNEGALYLVNGTAGVNNGAFDDLLIGRADGTAPNENFGSNLDPFTLTNGDVLVQSQSSSAGGFANAGTMAQIVSDGSLGGGNIIRGRIDGSSAGELLGQFGVTTSGDGVHYFVRSQLADPGGLADAGSIYFINQGTGTLANRIDGISAGELLGNGSPFLGSAGNFYIRSQLADVGGVVDAGRLIVASRAGAILGEATGNAASEFFGSSLQFVGSDIWVTATGHSNGAGGIFALANQDLGSGQIIRHALLGGAPGDALGSFGFSFIDSDRVLVRVPLADVGGVVDAGSALMVNTSLQLLGRTDGTSVNELYGTNLQFLGNGNLLFRSPTADIGSLTDAGVIKLVNPDTGNLIGQTAGTGANERFGDNFAIALGNNGFAIVSDNADSGGLVDAGAVVQISADTGLEIQRIVGTSAGEQFGSFGFQSSSGRLIFGSPLADVGGIVDAGRIVIFDPTTANQGGQAADLLFSNTPDGDFVLTTGAIQNALNAGANLILQANNDIVIQKGAVLTATGGSLTLNAGRSVIVNGLLNMKDTDITILANQNQAGVSLDNRASGVSEFALFDPQIIGRKVEISAEAVSLTGGDAPLDGSAPLAWEPVSSTDFFESVLREGTRYPATFVLGTQSLTVEADTVSLHGGTAPGAFAALVSFGDFSVNASAITLTPGTALGAHALFLGLGGVGEFTFDSCAGCGNELLFTDPFLDGNVALSGFFISGILQNPAIDSILAMLDRDEEDEDEKKKRCN